PHDQAAKLGGVERHRFCPLLARVPFAEREPAGQLANLAGELARPPRVDRRQAAQRISPCNIYRARQHQVGGRTQLSGGKDQLVRREAPGLATKAACNADLRRIQHREYLRAAVLELRAWRTSLLLHGQSCATVAPPCGRCAAVAVRPCAQDTLLWG